MTGPARNSSADDAARWAEAQDALAGPTEALRQQVRRKRLLVIGLVVGIVLLGLLIPLVLPEGSDEPARTTVPQPQRVAGLAVLLLGLAAQVLAFIWMWRSFRGRWTSPLVALTMRQNKQLLAMVRGTAPAEPSRVPLARHLAGTMLIQRPVLAMLSSSALLWTGMTLVQPSTLRVVLLVGFVLLAVVGVLLVRRNERQARRFLAEHPAPPGS